MDGIVNWISKNPYWVVAGLAATFIALILSIIALIKRNKKILSYTLSTTVLIESTKSMIDGIQILYQEKPVDSIFVTTFHLWNSGNVLLKHDDVYPKCDITLKLECAGAEILRSDVIKVSSDTCNINTQISESKNELKINFDYLEKKQGIILKIYHTDSELITLDGKLIEGKIIDKSASESTINSIALTIGPFDTNIFEDVIKSIINIVKLFPTTKQNHKE